MDRELEQERKTTMLKLAKYMKKSAGMIILIVILLFVQAYCDLALPGYTSNIVNIGIQQSGIEDVVADEIRSESAEKLFLFMTAYDVKLFQNHYELKENRYVLGTISINDREQLNTAMSKAIMIVSGLAEGTEQNISIKAQMQLPEDVNLLDMLAFLPEEKLAVTVSVLMSKIEDVPEVIATQNAITYIKEEYKALGINIDKLQQNYILWSGIKMLGLALVIMITAVIVTFLSCKVAAALSRDLRVNVYKKVMSFSNAEFNKFSTASLITRNTNDIQQIQMFMTMIFRIVLYAPILGIGGVIKVINTNVSMAWIIALAVGLILTLVLVLLIVAMPKFKKLQVLIDRLNQVTREILTGIPVIRAFSTQKHEEKRFEDANQILTKTNLFVNRCMAFMMPAMMLIMNGITLLIVYKGAYGVDNGDMLVGDIMAFIQYAMQIIMSFLMLTMMSIMMPRATVSASRINEILVTEPTIINPQNPKIPKKFVDSSVVFKNVSFSYPGADENVLDNISFTAKKGETTAFIGSTGSGKSTLINLVPRFYDVTAGEVLVDGVNVKDYDKNELCKRLGYVPQKGVLFSGTIDSNLRYGCEDAPKEVIQKAAEIAQSIDFINEKEDGFDSPIAQGGTNVSGGQKQRLSIGRAIAKNPHIYIFDDSFSALDFKTDITLRKALKEETKDAVTLIVAQRISTILHAEQIVVLDEGQVAGIGTHKELLKTCDVYKQIADSQLSKEELAHE